MHNSGTTMDARWRLRIDGIHFIIGTAIQMKFVLTLCNWIMDQWSSGCNGPTLRNVLWCTNKRSTQLSAGSRHSPPDNLVLLLLTIWQQMAGWQIIEAQIHGQGSYSAAKASAEYVSGDQEKLAVRTTEPCRSQTSFVLQLPFQFNIHHGRRRVSPIMFCAKCAPLHCFNM